MRESGLHGAGEAVPEGFEALSGGTLFPERISSSCAKASRLRSSLRTTKRGCSAGANSQLIAGSCRKRSIPWRMPNAFYTFGNAKTSPPCSKTSQNENRECPKKMAERNERMDCVRFCCGGTDASVDPDDAELTASISFETYRSDAPRFHRACSQHCLRVMLLHELSSHPFVNSIDAFELSCIAIFKAVDAGDDSAPQTADRTQFVAQLKTLLAALIYNQSVLRLMHNEFPLLKFHFIRNSITRAGPTWRVRSLHASGWDYAPLQHYLPNISDLEKMCEPLVERGADRGFVRFDTEARADEYLCLLADIQLVQSYEPLATTLGWALHAFCHFLIAVASTLSHSRFIDTVPHSVREVVQWITPIIAVIVAVFSSVAAFLAHCGQNRVRSIIAAGGRGTVASLDNLLADLESKMEAYRTDHRALTNEALVTLLTTIVEKEKEMGRAGVGVFRTLAGVLALLCRNRCGVSSRRVSVAQSSERVACSYRNCFASRPNIDHLMVQWKLPSDSGVCRCLRGVG